MYYLQNRYYNPEWGRFINADSLRGEVGKLLSHNVFVYCMNNPINMQDPSGYWGIGSILSSVKSAIDTAVNTVKTAFNAAKEYVINHLPNMNQIANAAGSYTGGAIGSIGDSAMAYSVSKQFDRWLFKPKTFKRALDSGLGGIYAASKFTKVTGVLGVASAGIGVWDNFAHYKHGLGRSAVDITAFGLGTATGVFVGALGTPVITAGIVGIVAGAGFAWGGNRIKDAFFSERK